MRFQVSEQDTAIALGSGDVPVLATPRLIAWLEAATMAAAADRLKDDQLKDGQQKDGQLKDGQLKDGQTSVGTAIRVAHRRPSPVGAHLEVTANILSEQGRRLTFSVQATDEAGALVAEGEIDRVIVDRRQFLDRTLG